jgi:hypothetical protein
LSFIITLLPLLSLMCSFKSFIKFLTLACTHYCSTILCIILGFLSFKFYAHSKVICLILQYNFAHHFGMHEQKHFTVQYNCTCSGPWEAGIMKSS